MNQQQGTVSRFSSGRTAAAPCDRRGTAAVVAMVVLLVVTSLTALLVQRVRLQWQQDRRLMVQEQLGILADQALREGVRRIREDAEWTGGRWILQSGLFAGCDSVSLELRAAGNEIVAEVRSPAAAEVAAVCRLTRKASVSDE